MKSLYRNIFPRPGSVLVEIDIDKKNWHSVEGTDVMLRLERGVENFNRRETEPVQGIMVSGDIDGCSPGDELLLHHNSTHEMHEVAGVELEYPKKVFSVPISMVYGFNSSGVWKPTPGFFFGLRVFKLPTGIISHDPIKIKDTVHVFTGSNKGLVVITLKSCDYEIVFQDRGREASLIRIRDEEVLAVDNESLKKIQKGEYISGVDIKHAQIRETGNYIKRI